MFFKKKNKVDKYAGMTRMQKLKAEAKPLTFIILAVLAFRSSFFEPFKIPSGSMIPTLLIGDFILVNKLSYGVKVPFSEWTENPIYLGEQSAPDRGDVIVFKWPKDTSYNYIKRVIGLPGDTVEVRDKVVYVNGQAIETEEIDGTELMQEIDRKFRQYDLKFMKTKTGDHDHITQVDQNNYYMSNYYSVTVPDRHVFVMGDNRDFSADSRSWGFVPFRYIKGRAFLIWFSLKFPWFWGEEQENFKFRPWRIGNIIP